MDSLFSISLQYFVHNFYLKKTLILHTAIITMMPKEQYLNEPDYYSQLNSFFPPTMQYYSKLLNSIGILYLEIFVYKIYVVICHTA